MNWAVPDPGSFRDPSGRVYLDQERVLRTVAAGAADRRYIAARDGGLYADLADQGLMLPVEEVDGAILGAAAEGAARVLSTRRLGFVSYPYEWSFAAHRRAALLHLDLHLAALERGFTLSDASAYNVQFEGARPVFIDHLSLRPYDDGEVWIGHRQFCMQFLNPLLCHTALRLAPNAWFRGGLEGIEPEGLAPLLPLRARLSPTVLVHVVLQAALQRRSRAGKGTDKLAKARLPKVSLVGMLDGLRRTIAAMKSPHGASEWGGYGDATGYTAPDAAAKRDLVAAMVQAVRPAMLWDLGCNTGDYAQLALEAGAGAVVGWDFDHGALDRAFARAEAGGLNFLPLWMDAANPSPSQGWAQSERRGLAERAGADAVLALALVHHLAIGRNIPLPEVVDWILGLAPVAVIEFPSKDDPMVRRLLALREDVFANYHEDAFLAAITQRARVVRQVRLDGGRLLVWCERT